MADPILQELLRLGREQSTKIGELVGEVRAIRQDQADHERRDEKRFEALEGRVAGVDDGLDEVTGQHRALQIAESKADKRWARWMPIVIALLGAGAGAACTQFLAHITWR